MDQTPRPRSIERIGEEFLAIVWEDGHESFFAAPDLRKNCPCAACRTQAEHRPQLVSSGGALTLITTAPRIVGIEEVGRYAVRLKWSDGHSSGLYEHRLLRALCRCDVCHPSAI